VYENFATRGDTIIDKSDAFCKLSLEVGACHI
jgi:hypothetical protein